MPMGTMYNAAPSRRQRKYYKRAYHRSKQDRKIAKIAKAVVNKSQETKYHDGTVIADGTNNIISATGYSITMTDSYGVSLVSPSHISGGTNTDQYIGLKIHPVHLSIRLQFDLNTVALSDTSNTITMLVCQAKGNFNPSITSASAIFQNVGLVTSPFQPLNLAADDDYRVLARKTININDTNNPSRICQFMIPAKKFRPMTFSDQSGTVEAGRIFISWVSDSTASPHPVYRIVWRLSYKDA